MNFLKPFIFLSLLLIPLAAGGRTTTIGGFKPIEDVKDEHVVEIGRYAVSEFNKREDANLRFMGVVSGATQVVAGTKYKLVVATNDRKSEKIQNYQAIVSEKPWMNYKKLFSFDPIAN